MGQLDHQTAIITGGGTGIGFALAKRFHEEGASVVICGRRESVLTEAAAAISGEGDRMLTKVADISKEGDVVELVASAFDWRQRIDILVNNAGAMRINKPPEKTSLAEWNSVIDTNITGTFLCCREVGKIMIKQKRGKIVNVSSMSGSVVNKYFHGGSYEVSKCAMNMLTKVLAVEWAQHNINVNGIAPGYYDTKSNRNFFEKEAGLYQKVLEMIPLGKLGNLEQLCDLILVLATSATDYMTGTTVGMDGGYTIH